MSALDVARRRGHEMVADYLAGRHGALAAGEMSPLKRDQQRAGIEKRLKTGGWVVGTDHFWGEKYFHSLWGRKNKCFHLQN